MTTKSLQPFLLSILLLGAINNVNAQADTTKSSTFGGFMTFPIDFPVIDTKAIDQELIANGLPVITYPTASLGIGFQIYKKRVITSFSFNKTTKKVADDFTEVEYRSTALSVGYSITKSRKFSLYPYFGFKANGLNYLYRERVLSTPSLGNYLQADLQYKEITNSRMHLDFGFGLSQQKFHIINCRFGYLLPMEKARWKINNNKATLTNAPGINYSYYFTLVLGFGGISKGDERGKD
jgi:hypothetical protein